MKKTILAMMALALAFGVTSCKNEELTGNQIPTVESAIITLDLADTNTRALGDAADGIDSTIGSLGVFVFTGNANTDACINKINVTLPLTAGKTGDLTTTDNAKYIFVVANAGDISNATNALNSVVNVGDMKAALADMGATTATQTSGNVLMTSADLVALSAFAGTPKKATASAALEFVGAKVILQWDEGTGFKAASGNWKFDLFVNQANAKALYFGNAAARSVVSASGFYSGIASIQNPSSATNVITTTLINTNIAKQSMCHYYLFGNNKAVKPTIIGVVARNSVTSAERYFTVHFNGVDAGGRTIVPGNVYDIKIKIKGDLDNTVTPPGEEEPEDEVNPGVIEVTITPASWNPRISIEKEV